MIKIDLENHFYDQSVIDALGKRTQIPFYDSEKNFIKWTRDVEMPQGLHLPLLLDIAEKRLPLMDRLRISKAVLSCSPGPEQLDIEESIETCRKTNDALAKICRLYPERFLGSAILPVNAPETACEEMERCIKEYGFVSWHTHSNYGDTGPDDPQYRPIFKKAAELGVYVYLHPQMPDIRQVNGYGFTFAAGLGFTVDTILAITRLCVSGIFDEYPDLKIFLGHLGEALPFLMERIDNRVSAIPNPYVKMKQSFSYYFKHNIMVTTSGNMSKEAFECAKRVLGMDNIFFGSDYPYEDVSDMMHFLDQVEISEEDREKLFYKNAEKLGIIS